MTDEEKQPWYEEAQRQKEAHQARLAKQMEDALEAKRAHHAAQKTRVPSETNCQLYFLTSIAFLLSTLRV